VPKPASLANGLNLKWDAWNRLVEVDDGQTVVGIPDSDASTTTGGSSNGTVIEPPRRSPSPSPLA
jgi:hypothetical protein